MSIIVTPEPGEATGEVAEIYAEDIADQGYVPAHTRVMAVNPEAYRAWENLIGAIARPMDKRSYELITLAAAGSLRSKACRLAHGRSRCSSSPRTSSFASPATIAMPAYRPQRSR